MGLQELSGSDQELILQSLRVITESEEIKDWEFHTRLGITRPVLRRIVSQWPEVDDRRNDSDEFLAINNCMNEVCHGIRLTPEKWALWFTQPRTVVNQTYKRWLRLGEQVSGAIR